jgi:hypothetical protein
MPMPTPRPSEVDPVRLLKAADTILAAMRQGRNAPITMWRDDAHPAKNGFSSEELVQGMLFLQRLGLVNRRTSAMPDEE